MNLASSNRPTRIGVVLSVAVAWLALPLSVAVAGDIEVESVHWGFDGRAVAPAFNPLTVIVFNPGGNDLAGELELQRLRNGYWPVGLPIRQPVFLSPATRRPVRFYPYVVGEFDDWRLSWISRDGTRRELDTGGLRMRIGEPANVLLQPSSQLTGSGGRLRELDESWFPPVSTATTGLGGVFLDHSPRWDVPRRRTFLEWLGRGGTLHVLKGPDGRPVEFGAELKVLNGTGVLTRVGAGRVIRQPFGLDEIPDPLPLPSETKQPTVTGIRPLRFDVELLVPLDDQGIFSKLRSMTRPSRNWILIYICCVIYMVVLFPGGFVYGQGGRDFRAVLKMLGVTVVSFSLIFYLVGRREDSARLTVRTATVAHHLAGGDLEYQQWVEAAATRGGEYRFTHQGRARLYSTAQNFEKLVGRIQHGQDASLTAEVAPHSSSTFLVHGRLPGEGIGLTPIEVEITGGQLQSLVLATGEGFPETVDRASVMVGGHRFPLVYRDGRLQFDRAAGVRAPSSSRKKRKPALSIDPELDQRREVAEVFDEIFENLVLRSLGFVDRVKASRFSLPPDRIRVFVYAPATDRLAVQVDETADQLGRVLHSWDLQVAISQ